MKIITAATLDYQPYVDRLRASVNSHGLELIAYDLGDFTPEVMEDGYLSTGIFKPGVMLKAFTTYAEPLLWLDADAKIKKLPAFPTDFDIAVAIRKVSAKVLFSKAGYRYGKYNAGVIYFNNTPLAGEFIKRWQNLTEWKRNDQLALNILLSGDFPHFYNDPIRLSVWPYTYNDSSTSSDTVIYHEKATSTKRIAGNLVTKDIG